MVLVNFYDIYYFFIYYVGILGGNIDDMREVVKLIEVKKVNVGKVVFYIFGLNDVVEIILNLL